MPELTGRLRFTHLYRRAGWGASSAEIDAVMALGPDEATAYANAVTALVSYPPDDVPDRLSTATTDTNVLIQWWLERMLHTRRPLLEKMVFFWHDHFATSRDKDGIDAARMLRQNQFFRANAFSYFETILNGISRDPAMIFWLDLNTNRRTRPNENYAREVMELFALGIGTPASPNYSEEDIRQATKAFTGYTVGADGNFLLNAGNHDPSIKTVLGRTCESGDDVNRILVSHWKDGRNVCAHYLTAKLFSFFAYPVSVDDPVVARLAAGFAARNMEIGWLVSSILASEEFSSLRAYRALVKSPVELAAGALRTLGAARVPTSGVLSRLVDQGQRLFYPPDVAGWPSGRAWVNASTTLSRCNMAASIVNSLGKTATTEAGGAAVATLLSGYATPEAKVDRVLGLLVDGTVPAATRQALIGYAATATTDEKIRGLFNLVMALPAYQLN